MSLLFHGRAVLRAVAGTLPPAADARLRAHLRGCAACRGRYDQLARSSWVLGAPTSARRERAALVAELDAPAQAPARRRIVRLAPALLLPAAAALVLWARTATPPPDPAVSFRGAAPGEEPAAPVRLLVFAKAKNSSDSDDTRSLRLVADLPGAGEGKVSLRDYVQLGYRGLATPSYVAVLGVDDAGAVHLYVPRPGAAAVRVEPAPGARALAPSIDLAFRHRPGRLRLYAVFSRAPLDEARLRQAARRAQTEPGRPLPLDAPALQVGGLLTIEP